jgi:hypothetical protein
LNSESDLVARGEVIPSAFDDQNYFAKKQTETNAERASRHVAALRHRFPELWTRKRPAPPPLDPLAEDVRP